MRLIDADATAAEIEENMKNGFPANENLSLYAIACIAHAPTVDVLDKIRDEIEHLTITEGGEDYVRKMAELYSLKIKVLQIIDKYR